MDGLAGTAPVWVSIRQAGTGDDLGDPGGGDESKWEGGGVYSFYFTPSTPKARSLGVTLNPARRRRATTPRPVLAP